jgi:hypothetical protein
MALEHQMDLMNGILDKVKVDISSNAGKTMEFIEQISEQKDLEVVSMPHIVNLENNMNDLHIGMAHKLAEINNMAN